METQNIIQVSEFVLLGFSQMEEFQKFLFVVFPFVYVITIVGTLLIMVTVTIDSQLHIIMYFFSEISLSSDQIRSGQISRSVVSDSL